MTDRASYAPLGDQLHSPDSLAPPFPSEYEAHSGSSPWQRVRRWWANVKVPRLLAQQEATPPPSGYLTLIPLSGDCALVLADCPAGEAWASAAHCTCQ
jgi:hypothetical protein